MSQNTVYLTQEGMDKLKSELHSLRTTERARITAAIADARAHGDLSENAEYDAAKEAQAHLEARIAQLEQTVQNARLVDEKSLDNHKVYILSKVTVKNTKNGSQVTYQLVSAQEADFAENKISVASPVGKGLLGKEVGDVVQIKVPAGKVELEVLKIER